VKLRLALDALFILAWAATAFAGGFAYAPAAARVRIARLAAAAAAVAAALVLLPAHRAAPPAADAYEDAGNSVASAAADCASARTAASGAARGALDVIRSDELGAPVVRDGARIPVDEGLALTGWAVGPAGGATARAACILVDGRIVRQTARYGGIRRDVAAALGTPAATASGYAIDLAAGTLRPGPHVLRIAVVDAAGRYTVVPLAFHLTVDAATPDGS
jgi:hypothetical protein